MIPFVYSFKNWVFEVKMVITLGRIRRGSDVQLIFSFFDMCGVHLEVIHGIMIFWHIHFFVCFSYLNSKSILPRNSSVVMSFHNIKSFPCLPDYTKNSQAQIVFWVSFPPLAIRIHYLLTTQNSPFCDFAFGVPFGLYKMLFPYPFK